MTPAQLKQLETDLRAILDRVPNEPGYADLRSSVRRAANTAGAIVLAPAPPVPEPAAAIESAARPASPPEIEEPLFS